MRFRGYHFCKLHTFSDWGANKLQPGAQVEGKEKRGVMRFPTAVSSEACWANPSTFHRTAQMLRLARGFLFACEAGVNTKKAGSPLPRIKIVGVALA